MVEPRIPSAHPIPCPAADSNCPTCGGVPQSSFAAWDNQSCTIAKIQYFCWEHHAWSIRWAVEQ